MIDMMKVMTVIILTVYQHNHIAASDNGNLAKEYNRNNV